MAIITGAVSWEEMKYKYKEVSRNKNRFKKKREVKEKRTRVGEVHKLSRAGIGESRNQQSLAANKHEAATLVFCISV